MIKSGDVIKHKAFMDCAVQVFYTTIDPETENTLIDGLWLNQGYVETMPINILANFFIRKEHLKNWLKCVKPDAKLIRNEEWIPLV